MVAWKAVCCRVNGQKGSDNTVQWLETWILELTGSSLTYLTFINLSKPQFLHFKNDINTVQFSGDVITWETFSTVPGIW